jgi:beta-N-acetylhexosaminidase
MVISLCLGAESLRRDAALADRSIVRASQDSVGSEASDSLLATVRGMTTRDKVGQLFMLGFSGSAASGAIPAITELRAGAIVFVANATSAEQASVLSSAIQQIAADSGVVPPLIAIDHEGGPVQRIREGVADLGSNWDVGRVEPIQAAIGAACSRGATHGRELAAMGVHVNLAPVVDVLTNPANSVIGNRSYGSDPGRVAQIGAAYIEGLQGQGVLAVAKHFPGHGGVGEDSHVTLPISRQDRQGLDAFELVPFRSAIQVGVAAVMTAHVGYPAVDPPLTRPASLSPTLIAGVLRRDLGFQGVVVTDDLGQMRAVTDHYGPGEAAVQALVAGSDVLLSVGPLARQREMVEAVVAAVGNEISVERLETSIMRVLKAKQAAGLLPGGAPGASPTSVC